MSAERNSKQSWKTSLNQRLAWFGYRSSADWAPAVVCALVLLWIPSCVDRALAAVAAASSQYAIGKFDQARAELSRGDLADARADVLEGLKVEPRSVPGLNLLGIIETEAKNYEGAIKTFGEALRLDPKSAETHTNLADCYAREARPDLAKGEYLAALRIDSRNHDANYKLGILLLDEGRAGEAIAYLDRVAGPDPAAARALDRAHRMLETSARSAKSAGHAANLGINYSDSADLKPGAVSGSVDAGGYSSQTQARGSELRQALGTLSPASASKTESGAAGGPESTGFQRASALLLGGDYAQAANAFQQGAAQFPESARMLLGLGVADYSRGLYTQAIDALCKAVDLSPGEPQAYFFLVQAYSASPAKTDDVLKRVGNYASTHPGSAPAQYYYALCLWRSRSTTENPRADPKQVADLLRSAVGIDTSLAEAHFELGVVLADQGEARQAASEFERAVAIDPQWAEAHYRLGQVYRQAGESDKAQIELEESERLRQIGETEDQRLRAEIRRFLRPGPTD
jgi:tetratricopeptide (TPR) repeat protein